MFTNKARSRSFAAMLVYIKWAGKGWGRKGEKRLSVKDVETRNTSNYLRFTDLPEMINRPIKMNRKLEQTHAIYDQNNSHNRM